MRCRNKGSRKCVQECLDVPSNLHTETNAMPFGMHMSDTAASLSAAWKRWFLRQDKVGIRDTKSLERASRAGLTNAYFSGCPTSILRRPTRAKQKADGGILVIDVHPSDLKYIPQDLLNRATFLTQIVHNCSVNILKELQSFGRNCGSIFGCHLKVACCNAEPSRRNICRVCEQAFGRWIQ